MKGRKEEIICGLPISDTDFHGYISTDILIHPWLFPSPLPPLEFWVCVLISESLCRKWLSLVFSFTLQDICYFFPLLLISLSIFSLKVHHFGDLGGNFIISVFIFQVWVIVYFIFVPHLFKISSVIGPYLGSVSWQLEEPLQWTLGYIFPFEWWFFCTIGPDVSIRILGLTALKFFLLACGGCPFKGLLPISIPREREGGSIISWLSPPCTVCRQDGHPWRSKWQPTTIYLPGESHEQRRLAGYSPWGRKELDTTEQFTNTHTT